LSFMAAIRPLPGDRENAIAKVEHHLTEEPVIIRGRQASGGPPLTNDGQADGSQTRTVRAAWIWLGCVGAWTSLGYRLKLGKVCPPDLAWEAKKRRARSKVLVTE
jgi:hypothetical protein